MAKRASTRKKGKSKKKRTASGNTGRRIVTFLKSDDFVKIIAVAVMLFALFLFVAILSFYLSPHHANWFGTVGESLAETFAKYIFGVASLGFGFLLFLYGLRLFGVRSLPLVKTTFVSLFWMAWLSCVLGYINHAIEKRGGSGIFDWAGTFGYVTAESLCHALKGFVPVLLIAAALVMLFCVHHVKLPSFQRQHDSETTDDEGAADDTEVDDIEEEDSEPRVSLWARLKAKLQRQPAEIDSKTALLVSDTTASPAEVEHAAVNQTTTADTSTEHPIAEEHTDSTPQQTTSSAAEVPFTIAGNDFEPSETPQEQEPGIDERFALVMEHAQRGNSQADTATTHNDPTFTIVETTASDTVDEIPDESATTEESPRRGSLDTEYDPHLDYPNYQMPSVDLLNNWEERNVKVTQEELVSNKDRIVETLRNYGIEITDIKAAPGPTVTLYEIKPAPGIRIAKIKGLEDDIALSLSALGIRIIAPLPGKGSIGIEVPNSKPQVVSMKTMLSSDAFQNTKYELPIALGKTIANEPYVTDLAKMPHLLMAGATGTGKSVGLNAVITSLLYKKHPSELKFIMVDPKKVELSLYSKIDPYYLAKMPDAEDAIITDVKKVVRTLNSLCIEMDTRYDLLKSAGVRKITEYNAKFKQRRLNPENGHRFLPYIVLVIDEFADLIMTAGKEVEMPIARLAQLARAVGIHLIVATQRPTTSIITGNIKTNFPGRIAFRVTSVIDSRVILDTGGANQLIGRGDMLISLAGSDMVRLQCALIETEEIERVVDFISQQPTLSTGFILPEYLDENEEPNKEFDPRQKDDMFNEAARLVVASQFGSTSLLQRKLQLGYNRAGRVIDQLEAAGIVGPHNGSKPREVLIHDEVELEQLLRNL